MFSFSVPKHAPSKLIDGKIILGGMGRVGGKAHKGPSGDPGVRRCGLQGEPMMKIKS